MLGLEKWLDLAKFTSVWNKTLGESVPNMGSKIYHPSFKNVDLFCLIEPANHIYVVTAVFEVVLSFLLDDHQLSVNEAALERKVEVLTVSVSDSEDRSLSLVLELEQSLSIL